MLKALFMLTGFLLALFFNTVSAQNVPKKVTPAQDGSLQLRAEVGKGVGPKISYMGEESAFGWFTAKDKVEWDIQVSNTGNYEVNLTWSVDDSESGKPFILETNGEQIHGTVGKTGSWEKFKTEKIGIIKIRAGIHKMVFRPASKFETIGDKGALLDLRGLKLVPLK